MKRYSLTALTLTALLVGALLSGCSQATTPTDTSKVWGYVAAAKSAQLSVEPSQTGAPQLVVKRVLSPTDGWVAVHTDMNGQPGMRIGLVHVKRGESTDVVVPLENIRTPDVIVALHADKGTPGTFDFDMMNKEMSPDRPFFVDGKELAQVVTIREYGIPTDSTQASLEASDQVGATNKLVIGKVVAPEPAWVVVHLEKDGAPGQRIGLVHVNPGETLSVNVPLDPLPLSNNLIVALHADRGDANLFNFDMDDKVNSTDQPFFVNGSELAIKVRVK